LKADDESGKADLVILSVAELVLAMIIYFSALKMLLTKLPPAEWAAMRSARAVLPSWMARAVSEVSEHA